MFLDCAPVYQNEREVGLGLKNGLEKNGVYLFGFVLRIRNI